MKKIKKIIVLLFALNIFAILLFGVKAYASELDGWKYPDEWQDIYHMSSPNLIEVDEAVNWKSIKKNATPFFEYQLTTLYGRDDKNDKNYVAILMNLWMTPNNKKHEYCRSDLLTVSTSNPVAKLVDGGPYSTIGVETITTCIGAGIDLSSNNNKEVTGSISGSFQASKTKDVYDLEVSAHREKLYASESVTRKFRVEYDYVNPYRNDCTYIKTSSKLQYCAIYEVSTNVSYFNIDFYPEFKYDGFFNVSITSSVYLNLKVDLNKKSACFI